jgi:glucoamylase
MARNTGLGTHVVDLPAGIPAGSVISFTIFWVEDEKWEGSNYAVVLD